MKITILAFLLSIFLLIDINFCAAQNNKNEIDSTLYQGVQLFTNSFFNSSIFPKITGYNKADSTTIDAIKVNHRSKTIDIQYDVRLAWAPFRENTLQLINDSIYAYIPENYKKYKIRLYSDDQLLSELIPNFWRTKTSSIDKKRIPKKSISGVTPIVTNKSKPFAVSNGLAHNHIALWHSHGWYYEEDFHRWEWQRARLFQTVEDLSPTTFVLQYLSPMLENAGAYVFLPRERDWQTNEVIVDNDGSNSNSIYEENIIRENPSAANSGFAIGNPPYTHENPFRLGTYQTFFSDKTGKQSISWTPDIPENGTYAVYISCHSSKENVSDANYTVYHEGGKTEFSINQQIGGGTWIYLGKFKFKEGINPENSRVVLSSKSKKANRQITADAVRFGGGMGNIEREGLISNRPRYHEGARYYLQYAGFPDSIIWNLHDTINDYVDDYKCRGEWVNYLKGAPFGPTDHRNVPGLGIPIDMSLAFHTDAGIAGPDTIIGTLGIYSTKEIEPYFPDGVSKMASRDLTDIIQTQIVDDIRNMYDSTWTRRGLWDKGYSEAFRPTVPAMLLELFSHQNFMDVRFGKEPQFQFDVSRAIYKGMLKFLSYQNKLDYVVTPLPVTHFQIQRNENNELTLTWKPKTDPLEPTAVAKNYVVYTRINDGDFDNGQLVPSNSFTINNIVKDAVYSFKVTAVNDGGESFPSEILSTCITNNESTVLIINGFDRIGTPAYIDQGNIAGFMDIVDQGVPFHEDIYTTGSQYDFDKNSPWLDDDSPGHGASYSDKENIVIPGNTFDFTYSHGLAIKNAGYSFVSVSDESVLDTMVSLTEYPVIDYLVGEEKTSYFPKNDSVKHYEVYPDSLLHIFYQYLSSGGSLFISGAHVGTDIKENNLTQKVDSILKFKWRTNHASKLGKFSFVDDSIFNSQKQFLFNTDLHSDIYTVEASDAIEPVDSMGKTIIRYTENNMSAGISYNGKYKVVAFGFPFEAIISEAERNTIMKTVLDFFNKE